MAFGIQNRFNEQFEQALASKMGLQASQANQNYADARLKRTQSSVLPRRTDAAVAVDLAQAALQNNMATDIGNRIGLNKTWHERLNEAYDQNVKPYLESEGIASGVIDVNRETYALGGAIRPPINPYEMKWRKYIEASKKADSGKPMSREEAIRLMAEIEAAQLMKQRQMIESGGTIPPVQQMAAGGSIEVDGRTVVGPGTGKSDSIPAMIDGHRPAALSNGEFIIPKHVVDYYGTKHFDTLVEKARMAGKQKQRKEAYRDGGAVRKDMDEPIPARGMVSRNGDLVEVPFTPNKPVQMRTVPEWERALRWVGGHIDTPKRIPVKDKK